MELSGSSKSRGFRQKFKDKGRSFFSKARAPGSNSASAASSNRRTDAASGSPSASIEKNENSIRPIWLEAFDLLSDEEARCLIEACPSFEHRGHGIKFCGSKEGLAIQIADCVIDAREKRAQHHPNIKAGFETAVRVLDFSKDLVSSVAASNPYAAAAWTATSFILPFLLAPSEQATEAVVLLGYIVHLVEIYRWYEGNYAEQADFRDRARVIYTKVYRAEIDLYVQFCDRNWLARLGHSIKDNGLWSDHIEALEKLDGQCRDLIEIINETRNNAWRGQEDLHYKQLHSNLNAILEELKEKNEEAAGVAVRRGEMQLRRLDMNYRGAKDQNPDRVKGTCYWFLRHPDFLNWRGNCRQSLLWVSADPGCGKSVLSRFVLEQNAEILSNGMLQKRVVCYFFFKDGIEDQMKASKAIGALIHQIILQVPGLHEHVTGLNQRSMAGIENSSDLWELLLDLINDHLLAHTEIICVIDALDECSGDSREDFINKIVNLFRKGNQVLNSDRVLKMIVTSRPYIDIEETFEDLIKGVPEIRLRGEEEHKTIEREIRLVIEASADSVSRKIGLTTDSSVNKLKQALLAVENKTYLWLHLVLDYLRYRDGRQGQSRRFASEDELLAALKQLPRSVEMAYEKMLDRSTNPKVARKLLHVVLAAYRPLSVVEAFTAIKINDSTRSHADLEDGFLQPTATELKNLCGLLLRVSDDQVFLIHQTAREFLVPLQVAEIGRLKKTTRSSDPGPVLKEPFWTPDSHLVMSKICINVLKVGGLQRGLQRDAVKSAKTSHSDDPEANIWKKVHLMDYSSEHLFKHLRSAKSRVSDEMWQFVCDTILCEDTETHGVWIPLNEQRYYPKSRGGNESCFVVNGLIEGLRFLDRQATGLSRYSGGSDAPLYLAVKFRQYEICEYLVGEGHVEIEKAVVEMQPSKMNDLLSNPLVVAMRDGDARIVDLLLRHSFVWVHIMGHCARGIESAIVPLAGFGGRWNEHYKRMIGHLTTDCTCPTTVLNVMREYERVFLGSWTLTDGTEVGRLSKAEGLSPSQATSGNLGERLLVRSLENVLLMASAESFELVEFLVDIGVDVDSLDELRNETALAIAVQAGQSPIVELLLKRGANPDLDDIHGLLKDAVKRGHYRSVKLLLQWKNGPSNLDWFHTTWLTTFLNTPFGLIKRCLPACDRSNGGQSLYALCLSFAIIQRRLSLIQFLLEKGADPSRPCSLFGNQTALTLASGLTGSEAGKLLRQRGARETDLGTKNWLEPSQPQLGIPAHFLEIACTKYGPLHDTEENDTEPLSYLETW